jgi:protease stability complex PrcB-like protein
MKMILRLTIVSLMSPLLVAAVAAAQVPREPPRSAPTPPGGSTELARVAKGDMSGVQTMRQVTVRTAAEWQKLWKEHSPEEKMPAVDFNSNMVVGIFLGSKPSAGYQVEILNVRPEGSDLVVEYAQKQPGRGMMSAQMLTEPYDLVAVPKHAGPVRFVAVSR